MAPILLGLVAGAAGAFFMDPQQGRRRRALVRDRVARTARESREFRDAAAQDLRARAQGVMAHVHSLRGGPVSDDVLVGRVRAKLGRYVSHRRAIHVTSQDGIVTLTGDVLATEHPGLIRALRMVSGVSDLDDRLDVHQTPEGVSALQGGLTGSTGGPHGQPLEILQARWAPGTRALVGGAGGLLVLYALARGGIGGVAAIAGGIALLARAKANRPLTELMHREQGAGTHPERAARTLAAI